MPRRFPLSLAATAAFASFAVLPAAAQDITVEGERAAEDAQVVDLVQELSSFRSSTEPATRFFDALCVSVSGLNEAGNAYVRDRINDNARAIGLPVQGEGCRNNAVVLIHDQPAALVEQIKDEVPHLLPRETRNHVRAQLADNAQVIVWHNEEDRDMGGRRMGFHDTMPGDDQVGGSLSGEARINVSGWPSRRGPEHSRGVVSAAIIFDGAIVEGMLIERLADYATLRLLAPQLLPLEGEAPEPASILAPFPADAGPDTLTRFDRAYLTALYALRADAPATSLPRAVLAEYENME